MKLSNRPIHTIGTHPAQVTKCVFKCPDPKSDDFSTAASSPWKDRLCPPHFYSCVDGACKKVKGYAEHDRMR